MINPTYSICIDWDCVALHGAHDFTDDDITGDVKSFRITRGKSQDDHVYPAATLELTLNNATGKYYPMLTTSPLYPKIRLGLPVRVQAIYNEVTYDLYYGYLNRITLYPMEDRQEAYFYATDGIDLLAKCIVIQDMDDKVNQSDGASVEEVLDAVIWSASRRAIDVDGGLITLFPDTFEFKK